MQISNVLLGDWEWVEDPKKPPLVSALTGTLCLSPNLTSNATGLRSLMVKQTVHLKTCNSFGHLTVESQVIHFPVLKSLSGTFCLTGEDESSSVVSNPPPAAPPPVLTSPFCFFLPANSDGKGWLMDRPWPGVREGFVEADGPCCI